MKARKVVIVTLLVALLGVTGLSQTYRFSLTQPLNKGKVIGGYHQNSLFQAGTVGFQVDQIAVTVKEKPQVYHDLEVGVGSINSFHHNYQRPVGYFSLKGISEKVPGFVRLSYYSSLDRSFSNQRFTGKAWNFYLSGFQASIKKGSVVNARRSISGTVKLDSWNSVNLELGLEMIEKYKLEYRFATKGGIKTKVLNHELNKYLLLGAAKDNIGIGVKIGKVPQLYFRIQKGPLF